MRFFIFTNEQQTEQRPFVKIECSLSLVRKQLINSFCGFCGRQTTEIYGWKRKHVCRVYDLNGIAVHSCERSPQGFMAPSDLVQASLQSRNVQLPAQTKCA